MSRWKELPNEILCEIFEQLKSNFVLHDLVECQLVCKNWRKHTSFILYRKLAFDECLQGEKFTECMQNSSLGSLVQEINFCCNREPDNERILSLIYKLAETCPNVEIFKSTLRTNHWNVLGEAVRNYWKQLKQLPEPQWSIYNHENTFVNYYTLASVCRRTLTHLVLPPVHPSSLQFTRVLPQLPFFINLTHLTVVPNYYNPSLMEFDEAIQQCPNLMCFTIDPYLMILDRNSDYSKRYDILSMQPHLKLKKLVVKICLHQDTFDYIMHKFPNLECCNVNLSFSEAFQNHIESWMTRHYEEKLRAFQKYLSSRRCDWFFTFGSFPLIEEHLQDTTNPVVRISFSDFPSFRIQQDNITWIMANTKENTDKLTELFKKYQHVIKEAYMKTSDNGETGHTLRALLSECKGLEKLTYEKPIISVPLINFPASYQILNSSLITLKLIVIELQPGVLSAYSYGFPELRNLIIESCYFDGMPPIFEIDMPKTKFNHLQIHLDSSLFFAGGCESEVKEAVLEITSQKSSPKRFLTNFVAPNQREELTTNKEYGPKFVINCACIDFLSLSINKTYILKKYPLLL